MWLGSGLLAAASLLIMAALVVVRAVLGRRSLADERRGLERLLFAASGDSAPASAEPASRRLAEVALDSIDHAASPAERDRIVARSRSLGVPQRLRQDLRARSPHRRSAAAAALADFADDDSVAALTVALADRDPDVRLSAALALAHMDRAPPASELVARLGLGSAERSLLVSALFDEIAEAHPEQILDVVGDPALPSAVRLAAIDAMSSSRDPRLLAALIEFVNESDELAASLPRYLEELGEFGDPAAGPAVARWLDSTAARVRAEAVRAAGRLGLVAEAPRLARLLGDRNWWVRYRAGEALSALGEDGHAQLRRLAARGGGVAERAAAVTLAERGLDP